jgi:hypothetical protein
MRTSKDILVGAAGNYDVMSVASSASVVFYGTSLSPEGNDNVLDASFINGTTTINILLGVAGDDVLPRAASTTRKTVSAITVNVAVEGLEPVRSAAGRKSS